MHVSSVAIAGDLLGVVTAIDDDFITLKDSNGVERKVKASACAEIINPYAEALLYMRKLSARVNKK